MKTSQAFGRLLPSAGQKNQKLRWGCSGDLLMSTIVNALCCHKDSQSYLDKFPIDFDAKVDLNFSDQLLGRSDPGRQRIHIVLARWPTHLEGWAHGRQLIIQIDKGKNTVNNILEGRPTNLLITEMRARMPTRMVMGRRTRTRGSSSSSLFSTIGSAWAIEGDCGGNG